MLSIGLLSIGKNKKNEFEHYAKKSDKIIFLDSEESICEYPKLNAIILHLCINEECYTSYVRVLKIVRNIKLPIWIISNLKDPIYRLILLNSGVLGIINEKKIDEPLLMIENMLNYFDDSLVKIPQKRKLKSETIEIILNSKNLSIKIGDSSEIELTLLQYKIFSELNRKRGETITYEEIIRNVWEEPKGENGQYLLRNQIHHIRVRLSSVGLNPKIIKSIYSKGYKLDINKV